MTIVVITAAKKTNPPKAPKATTAPRFNRAPPLSFWSFSTENGTFTFGAWSWRMLTLPAISLSCGCAEWMMVWMFLGVVSYLGGRDTTFGGCDGGGVIRVGFDVLRGGVMSSAMMPGSSEMKMVDVRNL